MIGRILRGALVAVLAGAGTAVVAAGPASAAELVVTTTADGGPGSLREAVQSLATDPAGDTVVLGSGLTYELTCAEGGALVHKPTPLVIEGNGSTIRMEDACQDRVLEQGEAPLTLRNVTIADGDAPNGQSGGGVFNGGSLALEGTTIRNNHAPIAGGGIAALGVEVPITIIDSTFVDNSAGGGTGGGGIFGVGDAEVRGSTFVGNFANSGGGAILLDTTEDSELTISNSTFTANEAGTEEAAAVEAPAVTLAYTTIADNIAAASSLQTASVVALTGGLTTFASVISGTQDGPNCYLPFGTPTTSQGYNFSDDDTCDLGGGPGDVVDPGGDPQLGAIADNGGPTLTMLPAAGGPLVDAIPDAVCPSPSGGITLDQRGEPRPGANLPPLCDIGAVELQGVAPPAPAPLVLEPTFTG